MTGPLRADSANHYLWGEQCDGWRLVERERLSLREERIRPGCAEIAHFHRIAHQIFYVLSGELTIRTLERTLLARPGEAVEIPPGIVHLVENCGEDDLRILLFSSPDTAGDRHDVEGKSNELTPDLAKA
jgi:quercetin dioxygenase-like cupin family protein